jgi:isocitrate lyase
MAVNIPVIRDADTGLGGPANIHRTIRRFEAGGVRRPLHLHRIPGGSKSIILAKNR